MTETKTKIREVFLRHFVAAFCQPVVTAKMRVLLSLSRQQCVGLLRTVWLR